MIVEALLTLAVNLVTWFATLVPDFGLDLSAFDMSSLWHSLGSKAVVLDGWVPVNENAAALGVFLVAQVVLGAWGLLVWVYHQFWGSE